MDVGMILVSKLTNEKYVVVEPKKGGFAEDKTWLKPLKTHMDKEYNFIPEFFDMCYYLDNQESLFNMEDRRDPSGDTGKHIYTCYDISVVESLYIQDRYNKVIDQAFPDGIKYGDLKIGHKYVSCYGPSYLGHAEFTVVRDLPEYKAKLVDLKGRLLIMANYFNDLNHYRFMETGVGNIPPIPDDFDVNNYEFINVFNKHQYLTSTIRYNR
jgi:hypothetical protein